MTTPIVLVGVTSVMGARVAARLKPEYEPIQFITSVERGKAEIPLLQAGEAPLPDPDNIGTHDFSRRPEAVVFGRGFDAANVEEIREACGGESSGLTWLSADMEDVQKIKAAPPNYDDPESLDKYTDNIARVIKDAIAKIKADGDWGNGGLHTY